MSGKFPTAFIGGIFGVMEFPGPSVSGNLDGNRVLWALDVLNSRADLLWINLCVNCVRAEIWVWRKQFLFTVRFDSFLDQIRREA